MNNSKNKSLEKLLILVVAFIFITMGIIIYQSYKKNVSENKDEIINNYYSSEFLFNNGYIRLANDISDFNDQSEGLYMYLDGDNIFHIKYADKEEIINKEIKGLPDGNVNVSYNKISDSCYEFTGLLKNDLYYVNTCVFNKDNKSFEKISTSASLVYVPSVNKEGVYVIDNKIISNFIIGTTTNEVMYIDYKDNILGLYSSIEKVRPYFDYVCASETSKICNDIMLYITFDKKLILNYRNDVVKTDIGDDLLVEDVFGVFEIKSNKVIDLDEISFSDLSNKYKFVFKTYAIDKDNNLYTITMNNNSIKNKKEGIAISKGKIKNIKYNRNNDVITSIIIVYEDGNKEVISSGDNYSIIGSTSMDRDNINKVK